MEKDNHPLRGVVAFIDVHCEGAESKAAIQAKLQSLGGRAVASFSKTVTHVVFKDGKKSTLEKVGGRPDVKLVNVMWVEACSSQQAHVEENAFTIDPETTPVVAKRSRSMKPQALSSSTEATPTAAKKSPASAAQRSPLAPPLLNATDAGAVEDEKEAEKAQGKQNENSRSAQILCEETQAFDDSFAQDTGSAIASPVASRTNKTDGTTEAEVPESPVDSEVPTTPIRQQRPVDSASLDLLQESPSLPQLQTPNQNPKKASANAAHPSGSLLGDGSVLDADDADAADPTASSDTLTRDEGKDAPDAAVLSKPGAKRKLLSRRRPAAEPQGQTLDDDNTPPKLDTKGADEADQQALAKSASEDAETTGSKVEKKSNSPGKRSKAEQEPTGEDDKPVPATKQVAKPKKAKLQDVTNNKEHTKPVKRGQEQGQHQQDKRQEEEEEVVEEEQEEKEEEGGTDDKGANKKTATTIVAAKQRKPTAKKQKRVTIAEADDESGDGASAEDSADKGSEADHDGEGNTDEQETNAKKKSKTKSKKGKGKTNSEDSSTAPKKRKKKLLGYAVASGVSQEQLDVICATMDALEGIELADDIDDEITHIISSGKRTLKVLEGITRGCWIVSMDWVTASAEAGHWLDEADYELSDTFPGVSISRKRKQGLLQDASPLFPKNITVYIGAETTPSRQFLQTLVTRCGGQITRSAPAASIVVGQPRLKPDMDPVDLKEIVSEKWLLDCITHQAPIPTQKYTITLTAASALPPTAPKRNHSGISAGEEDSNHNDEDEDEEDDDDDYKADGAEEEQQEEEEAEAEDEDAQEEKKQKKKPLKAKPAQPQRQAVTA